MFYVPVVNSDNQPLMPTYIWKAKKWIVRKLATPFWKKGVFCVRLNVRTAENKQEVGIGIDPGSKKEGFTIKSQVHTYLNIQADAVTWVKKAMEIRRIARKTRRYRKTPCRKPRWNRASLRKDKIPPSIKARWQWKLRVLNWLYKLFPISRVIVEDIKAKSTGQKKWDKSFSPLEVGKHWFYKQISNLETKQGWETKELRDSAGLKKSSNKLSNSFYAHCVDSWVLANDVVGGHIKPDNKSVLYIKPLRFYRRQLHVFNFTNGGKRRSYGGTRSLGFKRGSLVKHKKHGLVYVGGTMNKRISLHCVETGVRLTQHVRPEDCKFLAYNSWIFN